MSDEVKPHTLEDFRHYIWSNFCPEEAARMNATFDAALKERDETTAKVLEEGADLLASFLWAEGVDAEKRGVLLRTINRMRSPRKDCPERPR